mgnify:CR=1 FL=1
MYKRQTNSDAADPCRYNFLTNNPEEIAYDLKNYIGCRQTTADGKNYKFADATLDLSRNRGVIFVPRKVAGGGGAEPSMFEVSFSQDLPEVSSGWVFYKSSVNGRVKFGPDVTSKVGFTISDGQIKDIGGAAVIENFLNFADLTVGFKWKLEDMTRSLLTNRTALRTKLGEAVEGTFKAQFPFSENVKTEVDFGLTLSVRTPFVINVSGVFAFTTDIGPALGLQMPYMVKAQTTFQISFKIGPGPTALQLLAKLDADPVAVGRISGASGAAFVAFAYIGLISFGAWYAGNAARRGECIGLASWYVDGYLYQCGFRPTVTPTSDPELMLLIGIGKADAIRDAHQNFPGNSDMQAILQWSMLWILGAGGTLATDQGAAAGRNLLEHYLFLKLKKRFGF